MGSKFELEVCVDEVENAIRAIDAGATRIEMNRRLDQDGLTPNIADCESLVRRTDVPIIAMLRPHDNGYLYDSGLLDELFDLGRELISCGVAGLAFGCMVATNGRSQMNFEAIGQVSEVCGDRELVIHRVFDELGAEQQTVTNELVKLGVKRILTSGGAASALEGAQRLAELQVSGGIEILPGAGIQSKNAVEILEKTGCNQLHGSFRMGGTDVNAEDIRKTRELMEDYFR